MRLAQRCAALALAKPVSRLVWSPPFNFGLMLNKEYVLARGDGYDTQLGLVGKIHHTCPSTSLLIQYTFFVMPL